MNNFDDVIKENIKEHNPNWPKLLDHPYRILIINLLFNLINQEPDIDKIHLCAKDPYKAKYKFLIKKRQSTGSKHLNDFKAFIEHSNNMDNTYKNI